MKPKLVIVGNGMAGIRTLEELLKMAPDKYDITVFGAEPHGNYNRILLSPLLAGEKSRDEIMLNEPAWYAERGITLHLGKRITRINRRQCRVTAEDGTYADYDRLLLATGSRPVVLPLPGREREGVVTFRDIADVERMLAVAAPGRRAVVIGGGLLGLEAASGLLQRGMRVTVVHLLPVLMERQMDPAAAALLRRNLEERGLDLRLGAETAAILGDTRVIGVRFKDGTEIPADLVVMAVGIRPNIDLAQAAGLHCERGIVVDDTLQTYDPRIYAVGECIQHRRMVYGLVAPLWEQARVCANHLAGWGKLRYPGSVTGTRLKVSGVELFSAGDFQDAAGSETIVLQDPTRGIYKKLVIKDDRVRGAVLYGDTTDGPWYFQLMQTGTGIGPLRETLIFGQANAREDLG